MRMGRVIGLVTYSRVYDTLVGGRFVAVEVWDRFALAGQARKPGDVVIAYDTLGAGAGDVVAFTESREAAQPFYPEKLTPLDAYVTAILDRWQVTLEGAMAK